MTKGSITLSNIADKLDFVNKPIETAKIWQKYFDQLSTEKKVSPILIGHARSTVIPDPEDGKLGIKAGSIGRFELLRMLWKKLSCPISGQLLQVCGLRALDIVYDSQVSQILSEEERIVILTSLRVDELTVEDQLAYKEARSSKMPPKSAYENDFADEEEEVDIPEEVLKANLTQDKPPDVV